MTKTVPPSGFSVSRVYLAAASFKVMDPGGIDSDSGGIIVDVETTTSELDEGFLSMLTSTAKDAKGTWQASATYIGRFKHDPSTSDIDANVARQVNAPATLYAFARQTIADLASKSHINAILPLTNFKSTSADESPRALEDNGG